MTNASHRTHGHVRDSVSMYSYRRSVVSHKCLRAFWQVIVQGWRTCTQTREASVWLISDILGSHNIRLLRQRFTNNWIRGLRQSLRLISDMLGTQRHSIRLWRQRFPNNWLRGRRQWRAVKNQLANVHRDWMRFEHSNTDQVHLLKSFTYD